MDSQAQCAPGNTVVVNQNVALEKVGEGSNFCSLVVLPLSPPSALCNGACLIGSPMFKNRKVARHPKGCNHAVRPPTPIRASSCKGTGEPALVLTGRYSTQPAPFPACRGTLDMELACGCFGLSAVPGTFAGWHAVALHGLTRTVSAVASVGRRWVTTADILLDRDGDSAVTPTHLLERFI